MAGQRQIVRARCKRATAADYNYYRAGQEYLLDLEWAQEKDILRHFDLLEEVKQKDAEEEVRDGMKIKKKRAEENKKAADEPKKEKITAKE